MLEEDNTQEIWESTTGGTVWVQMKDPRAVGGWRTQKVGGRGTKRLTITVGERLFNQELIPFENAHLDPFQNGLLVRISPKEIVRGEYEVSDEQLAQMLEIANDAVFAETMESVKSEVVLRRLLQLAEKHATLPRYQTVQALVDQRYRKGKTSKVVKELIEDDARYSLADL